jgi:hypothetical protein
VETFDMALTWTIDPINRLMVAVALGEVTRADMERYLDSQISAGAVAYRKIFDGGQGDTSMTADDLMALGVRIRSIHAQSTGIGPLAIVVPADKEEFLKRLFGMLAIPSRPMRVFNDTAKAYRWIAKQVAV